MKIRPAGLPQSERTTCPANNSWVPSLEPVPDFSDHFFVLRADGEENCFQWLGVGQVNGGRGMEFGPVEKTIKGLLVFFFQNRLSSLTPQAPA